VVEGKSLALGEVAPSFCAMAMGGRLHLAPPHKTHPATPDSGWHAETHPTIRERPESDQRATSQICPPLRPSRREQDCKGCSTTLQVVRGTEACVSRVSLTSLEPGPPPVAPQWPPRLPCPQKRLGSSANERLLGRPFATDSCAVPEACALPAGRGCDRRELTTEGVTSSASSSLPYARAW
jgi:hypothetical protein